MHDSIHIGTISMEFSILYFKGFLVKNGYANSANLELIPLMRYFMRVFSGCHSTCSSVLRMKRVEKFLYSTFVFSKILLL